MAYYSGSVSDIKVVLRTLNIGSGTLDNLDEIAVAESQAKVDAEIDSTLSNLYYTPLSLITRNSVSKYPDPIPYMARRLVAADLIINSLVDVNANVVQTAQNVATSERQTLFEMGAGNVGSQRLAGQVCKSRNHFQPSGIVPSIPPVQR